VTATKPRLHYGYIGILAVEVLRAMRINWSPGIFRIWVVVSIMWCALVALVFANRLNIAWPLADPRAIHVKISDTETWDYPADWDVARIKADLKKRVEGLNQKDREWLAGLSDMRKAECGPNKTHPMMSDINHALNRGQTPFDEECEKSFWVMSGPLVVPTG
jgi:hypothetical protein